MASVSARVSKLQQGQGSATDDKERGIALLCGLNLEIVRHISGKHPYFRLPYFHFDLHAGCGWNKEVDVIGSPLAFLRKASRIYPHYFAHFIDNDESAARQLAAVPDLAGDQRAIVHLGDNLELVGLIPYIIRQHLVKPEYAYGTVLIDPNGPAGGIPWDGLADLFSKCPRLDCIINYPSTGMKRAGRDSKFYVGIDEIPSFLNKRHWLVREPIDKWQWCLMFGTNGARSGWKSQRFHEWDSPRGRSIREVVSKTKKELVDSVQMRFL